VVVLERLADLQAFVGLVNLQNLDFRLVTARGPQSFGDLLESIELVPRGDQNQLGWLAGQNALQRR